MAHNSTSLIPSLSAEAAASLENFQKEYSDEFCYHSDLLRRLIPFLTDEFDIEVDLDFLPTNEKSESQDEENVRRVIIRRLLNEFWDMNWGTDHDPEDENDTVDYRLLVKVFYWHLNRQPRRPSNLNRLGHVKTRVQRVEELAENSMRNFVLCWKASAKKYSSMFKTQAAKEQKEKLWSKNWQIRNCLILVKANQSIMLFQCPGRMS